MTDPRLELIASRIRSVPDFPKPGILFRDITPLLGDPVVFDATLEVLAERLSDRGAEVLVGIESRGFIFGAALAARMRLPFVPVRKPGKLPGKTVRVDYSLEYGTDALEMHADAFAHGASVVIVDDLLATGGTARAAAELVTRQGGLVSAFAFVIELGFLKGAATLQQPTVSLITY
jgi:adenine phosphoribosyltransferase